MSNIWFSSDYHLAHAKDFIFGARGFKSVEEMNEAIIKNHNDKVAKNDTVYYLGDFTFSHEPGKIKEWRDRLNGDIHFIKGNHDQLISDCPLWTSVSSYKEIKIDKIPVVLFHFPILEWNRAHHGAIALSGHTHSKNKLVRPDRRGIHVGVDSWGCSPVSWDEVKALALSIPVKPFEVDNKIVPIKE